MNKRETARLYRQVWQQVVDASARPFEDHWIYVVESKLTGLVKIGITTQLRARLARIRNATGGGINPLFCFRGNRAVEQSLHILFAAHRAEGEWFRREGLVDVFIRDMQAESTSEEAVA